MHGLPIGNLTSQIFANIYLNELDQFILHTIKPLGYVRYGDDFVLWCGSELHAKQAQMVVTEYLYDELGLRTNPKHDRVQLAQHQLTYLGVDIWPKGRRLQKKVSKRITQNLSLQNLASYDALIKHHQPQRYTKRLSWKIFDIID